MSVSKSVRNLGGTARERPIFRRLVGGISLRPRLKEKLTLVVYSVVK